MLHSKRHTFVDQQIIRLSRSCDSDHVACRTLIGLTSSFACPAVFGTPQRQCYYHCFRSMPTFRLGDQRSHTLVMLASTCQLQSRFSTPFFYSTFSCTLCCLIDIANNYNKACSMLSEVPEKRCMVHVHQRMERVSQSVCSNLIKWSGARNSEVGRLLEVDKIFRRVASPTPHYGNCRVVLGTRPSATVCNLECVGRTQPHLLIRQFCHRVTTYHHELHLHLHPESSER